MVRKETYKDVVAAAAVAAFDSADSNPCSRCHAAAADDDDDYNDGDALIADVV